MKKFLKNKKGFMSIYVILWMTVLFPLLMFSGIDLSQYIYENTHLKEITDNATASAITQINEDLVPQGVLQVDATRAQNVVNAVIQDDLQLNGDFTPKDHSPLRGAPTVQVYVINSSSDIGTQVNTPAGTVTVYKPSVVVYAKYPVKGLFYKYANVTMQKIGISQVQFAHQPKTN